MSDNICKPDPEPCDPGDLIWFLSHAAVKNNLILIFAGMVNLCTLLGVLLPKNTKLVPCCFFFDLKMRF